MAHSLLSIPLPGQKSAGPKKEASTASLFDVYEFSQRKTTKLLPLTEIVKQEKGQRGLDEMKKKSADIIKIEQQQNCIKQNWQGGEPSLKSENQGIKSEDVKSETASKSLKRMTIERTLKLDKNNKELEITTTIKKMDATPKKAKAPAGKGIKIKKADGSGKQAATAGAVSKKADIAQKKMLMRKKAALAKAGKKTEDAGKKGKVAAVKKKAIFKKKKNGTEAVANAVIKAKASKGKDKER